MKSIRNGVFETNSSSTHSLILVKKSDYNKWVNGDIYYHVPSQTLTDTRNTWCMSYDDLDAEIVTKDFTNVDGEEMIAVSIYTCDN